jgi:RNA polymerase sigma-70 factor (ECF subfamily)
LTDETLIQALKQGNKLAFNVLVQQWQHMVYNTVLGILQHEQEAEDTAQEVFVQVYLNIHTFRGDAKLSTWIYRIAITKALDRQRKAKAKKRMGFIRNKLGLGVQEEAIPDFQHPGITLDQKEQSSLLFKALQKLPEQQKAAFVLIKTEGLTYEEVSHILNTTVKGVEGLMHRAKENLRKHLSGYFNT